jgi:glycine/D-amino acid oxidase-like deaminating enzyme/nitrite reductase/ring-hydroxylating ferredoxin subunit
MKPETKQTSSIWMLTERIPWEATLTADADTYVCVIGAGIAGLTTAYLLLQEGKPVIVLDDSGVGSGQTQRTTAHLSNAIDDRYANIERWHGLEAAKLAAASHTAGIDLIEAIGHHEHIACDFERLDGYLFAAIGESRDTLEVELQAARRSGLTEVEWVARASWPEFDTGPCLRFPDQGQFHPLKYLAGLTKAVLRMGGRIFTRTHAEEIEGGPPARIRTRQGPVITASRVVVATNSPINDRLSIHTKQAPYLTYVAAYGVPKSSVGRALYWDTADPYHYVRLQPMPAPDQKAESFGDPQAEELLIVGGEDHKTGQADDSAERYSRLDMWARERFPIRGPIRCRWSGQVMETIDGLAFIGRNPGDADNVYIATGDSGMGMTHGTIAGILITDLIMGRESPWEELYDPGRKTVRAAGEFLEENLNVARQYASWFTGGDASSTDEITRGSGAVVRHGLSQVAVFRDGEGVLHECSAVCPHLGCIVEWNHNENTWDCPCHGSRFDAYGKVINGPANTDLKPVHELVSRG